MTQRPTNPSVTRQGRVSKTRALSTIRGAVNVRVTPVDQGNDPAHSEASPARLTPSGPDISDSDGINRLGDILIDGFDRLGVLIRQTTSSTFDQLMEHLDSLNGAPSSAPDPLPVPSTVSAPIPTAGFNSGMSTHYSLAASAPPLNILLRWSRVDYNVVESIANGNFVINYLPTLYRAERNRHFKHP